MNQSSRAPDRERTFRALYEAVYPDLLRFAQRRSRPDHAEDVVADAFLVVWRRLDELMTASSEGIEVDVTYGDGTTATVGLDLGR